MRKKIPIKKKLKIENLIITDFDHIQSIYLIALWKNLDKEYQKSNVNRLERLYRSIFGPRKVIGIDIEKG